MRFWGNGYMVIHGFVFLFFNRKRDKRAWGEDGEWQAEESEKTPDNLLQLPAGRLAEAVSEHTVPGAAGESRTGRLAGANANTGGIFDEKYISDLSNHF